jgi:hypothetical protein
MSQEQRIRYGSYIVVSMWLCIFVLVILQNGEARGVEGLTRRYVGELIRYQHLNAIFKTVLQFWNATSVSLQDFK